MKGRCTISISYDDFSLYENVLSYVINNYTDYVNYWKNNYPGSDLKYSFQCMEEELKELKAVMSLFESKKGNINRYFDIELS